MSVHRHTNLRELRPIRKKPERGDVFVMQLPDLTHLFGRVIDADMRDPQRAPVQGCNLIYVYDQRSSSKDPDLKTLTPDRLLLPPVFVNRTPWTRGYFEVVGNASLTPDDVLSTVSYWDALRSRYVDQEGSPLPGKVHPAGIWAVASYRGLDDRVSDALSIPRAP